VSRYRGPGLVFFGALAVLFVILLAYACGAGVTTSGAVAGRTVAPDPAAVGNPSPAGRGHCPDARRGFVWYRAVAARWYRQMGARLRGKTAPLPRPCSSIREAAKRERLRARIARRTFEAWFVETFHRWRCVHEREGAWNANTGNGYFGGLQMDTSFQLAYGRHFVRRWGWAHRWPIWAQLVAAERARAARGWHPWPNTARDCGLL
jgi:Transglycosylase-like domain